MRRVLFVLSCFLALAVMVSCSKFRKIEKNPDWRVKYDASLAYYNKKDYYRASVLFEQILPIIRGLPEAEKVQFYQAYCQYYEKLYLLAAEQFRTFYETYGRSALAEEARYMHAYSLFRSSPGSNLDQTGSVEAMAAMQEFLNRYPSSRFRDQATEVIYTVQARLEEKGFANALQYYKMKSYKAAIVALENFRKNFPDSKYLEQAQYYTIASQFDLAEQSIRVKQKERYQEVVNNYLDFLDRYPKSQWIRDAERMYAESLSKLTQFKNNNS